MILKILHAFTLLCMVIASGSAIASEELRISIAKETIVLEQRGATLNHHPGIEPKATGAALDDGQIIASGISSYSSNPKWPSNSEEWQHLDLAITGGTGKYLGAYGTVTSKQLNAETYVHTIEIYTPVQD